MINSRYTLLPLTIILPFLILAYKLWSEIRKQQHPRAPSPPALPIIGHLHLIKIPLHRSLQTLTKKYGPIISLKLGSRQVIIISSPSAVEECFTKNDIVFANRPAITVYKYMSYNCTTLATSSYGHHWRNLRRISVVEVFSSSRLNMFLEIRRDEIKILLNQLYSVSRNGFVKVELKPILMELTLNTLMRMVAGKRYYGGGMTTVKDEGAEAKQFKEMISEVFECAGASYLGDYLPILKWVDCNTSMHSMNLNNDSGRGRV